MKRIPFQIFQLGILDNMNLSSLPEFPIHSVQGWKILVDAIFTNEEAILVDTWEHSFVFLFNLSNNSSILILGFDRREHTNVSRLNFSHCIGIIFWQEDLSTLDLSDR